MKNRAVPSLSERSFLNLILYLFLIGTFLLFQPAASAQQSTSSAKANNSLKIFMIWDMEGTSGLFTKEHVWYWEEGVRKKIADEGRDLLIADVNSACRAALNADVDELIICDAHHGGNNIQIDKMLSDSRITYLVKSVGFQDKKRRWLPGLDESVDGIMLMAHHAKAGTEGAFLPHTWSGQWADFIINGQSIGEIGIETCYAGYWNIPLILVQGDEAACREADQQFPGIVSVVVKHAESYDKSSGLDAQTARQLTADKITEAVNKLRTGCFKPFKPEMPATVTILMKSSEAARNAARKPGVQRIDSCTVGAQIERQCDIIRWITGNGLDMPEQVIR